MDNEKYLLTAHLMRRAGFGATRLELSKLAEEEYEDIVEGLLSPTAPKAIEDALVRRYHPDQSVAHDSTGAGS